MDVRVKRVYEPVAPDDGYRVLVDRLWPRGVSKEKAHLDLWLKEVAPSAQLRIDFHQHLDDWDEFAAAYRAELVTNPAVETLLDVVTQHDRVTLLYGLHDPVHNHAVLLREVLEQRISVA